MTLAAVRSLGATRQLRSAQELEDFEQELVDQYALAAIGSGVTDEYVASERSALFEFVRFLGRSVWTASTDDADRFLAHQRKTRRLGHSTVRGKALTIGRFYDFLMTRYQGEVYSKTGHVLVQPIDEYNRPSAVYPAELGRVPPTDEEVEELFGQWGDALPDARKYLPACRDYLAASLWRRIGPRIMETVMLDIRDWRADLGERGQVASAIRQGQHGPRSQASTGRRDQLR